MEKLIRNKFDSIKAFCDAAGTTYDYWKMIRRGERNPSAKMIESMAKVLKVPGATVYAEISKMQKKNTKRERAVPV